MFKDRFDAGKKLAQKLEHYSDEDPIVLAIPRGGVPVGFEVAKHLNCRFSLVIARKLPFPYNPEAGFGAIAEDGSTYIMTGAMNNISQNMLDTILAQQKEEIKRRVNILRGGRPLPELQSQTVILVDDGIAMGSTIQTAIKLCEKKEAEKIIVGSPVSSPEVARSIGQRPSVAETIILETPKFFRAVAQVYEHWYDVPDHEVLEIMNRWQNEFA